MDDDALEDLQDCPEPCAYCDEHGYCDDCLDCLSWPRPAEEPPSRPRRVVHGYAEPSLATETARRRQQLQLTDLIPIAIRRYRRDHGLSQRALAAELRWSRSMVARAETRPSQLTLEHLLLILLHSGHRLALTTDAGSPVGPLLATTPELLGRDAAGRRLPPFGEALRRDEWCRLTQGDGVRHQGAWTWRRPS